MRGPVVVGVDGARAERALEYGAALARALNVDVVPVHAVADPQPFPYGSAAARELARRRALSAGELLVTASAERAGVAVDDPVVVLGSPEDALRREAEEREASLVVVAPRRRSRLARRLSPSVSGTVARDAPAPVVVVPVNGHIDSMRLVAGAPIVVGADGSPEADRALVVARALADDLEAPLLPIGVDVAGAAEDALRYRNVHAHPGQALVEIARRARGAFLVVGTAGGTEGSGSVAQRLIARAPVPLVVVARPNASRL